MRKLYALIAAISLAGSVYAAQVNPTSNVLGDTAATANTLVYRNASGTFDAASLTDETVVTNKIATSSILTYSMYLDLPTAGILCVTTTKRLGTCQSGPINSVTCSCS